MSTLDLAPIQQYNGPYLDLAGDLAKGQELAKGKIQLDAEKNLPNAIAAYKNGDQGALMQIAQANPDMAKTILSMEEQKQTGTYQTGMLNNEKARIEQEGKYQTGELDQEAADLKQRTALEAPDIAQKKMEMQQAQMQRETSAVSATMTALQGVDSVADKKAIYKQMQDSATRQGIQIPPGLQGEWTPDHEVALGHMAHIGEMQLEKQQMMNGNAPADIQSYKFFQHLSPEDQQKYVALQAKMPFIPGAGTGAPTGAETNISPSNPGMNLPGSALPQDNTQPRNPGMSLGGAAPAKQADAVSLGYVPAFGGTGSKEPVPLTDEQQKIESVLAQAPPQIANTARSIITGHQQGLQGYVMKSPYGQAVMGLVTAADPSFDNVNYQARAKVRADFASSKLGTTGGSIALINSTLPLLDKLQQASDKLGGVDSGKLGPLTGLANSAENAYKKGENSVALRDYESQQAVTVPEMIKVLKNAGGNKEDLEIMQKALASSSSPDQRTKAIQDFANAMQEKVATWQQSYQSGMGTAAGQPDFLNARSKAVMGKLGIEGYGGAVGAGAATGAASPKGVDPAIWAHMTPEEQGLFK